MKPKISFVLAAYNEEKHLAICIQSCLDQSYPNIEVCVTDDGSSDNTWQILEGFKSDTVKVHQFSKNRGKVAAFNQSYSMATGEYIAIIGADDVNLPDRIEKQLKLMEDFKLDLTWGRLAHIDEEGGDLPDYRSPFKMHPEKSDILQDNFIPGNTVTFNKEVAKKVFPIPEQLKFEDWWIAFNTIYYFKYKILDRPVVQYRIHSNNTVGNQTGDYTSLRRKNIKRHLIYHDLFNGLLNNKENKNYQLMNCLVKNYKKACLSDQLIERIGLFLSSIKLFRPQSLKVVLKFLFVTLLGLKTVNIVYKIKDQVAL
jgi:glycosyltransferase involved in cell wall biosynthesis